MATFSLNPQQQEAVNQIQGPLLLLAGAGTGKTRVIVQRIDNMLNHGISPSSILAVTFTNKAATEMKERIAALGNRSSLPTVSTFHSFCVSVLRAHADKIGLSRNFTIATEGYQKGLLRNIAIELKLDGSGIDPYTWLSRISLAKAYMLSPDDMAEQSDNDSDKISAIYARYQSLMRRMDMVDFDDLLTLTRELWLTRNDVLESYRDRYRYIMIDEYQDTNKIQLNLIVLLVGKTQNICAVGDDDQSIYGWRGANQENILEFEKFFPGTRIIRLEQNYRSTNTILKAANAVISHNSKRHEKNLWSNNGDGEKIKGVLCEDEHAEANFIADSIFNFEMRGKNLLDRHQKWSRYAIIFRTGGQSRIFEETFRKRRMPFALVGSKAFYQRKEILDILTMLELAVNNNNDMALQRVINVPPRGIGDATLDKLSDIAARTHASLFSILSSKEFTSALRPDAAQSISDFKSAITRCAAGCSAKGAILPRIKRLLDDISYIDKLMTMYKPRTDAIARKENVEEFLNSVQEYDEEKDNQGTLQDYIEQIALKESDERNKKDDSSQEAVRLMTIHAAKGLEFPVVYLAGCEQRLFPHQMAIDEGSLEEERRLCYVAMTRAKDRLFLTYAQKRRVMNMVTVRRPSMFIDEIPAEFIEFSTPSELKDPQENRELASDYLAQIKERLKKGMKP